MGKTSKKPIFVKWVYKLKLTLYGEVVSIRQG